MPPMIGPWVTALKHALAQSHASVSMASGTDAYQHFAPFDNGSWTQQLNERMRAKVLSSVATGFELRDFRGVIGRCHLLNAVNSESIDLATLEMIASCLKAGSVLVAPSDPVWVDVMLLGRAIRLGNNYAYSEPVHGATADAAKRLMADGFTITATDAGIDLSAPVFTQATDAIRTHLSVIGRTPALTRLWQRLRPSYSTVFHQYLIARNPAVAQTHQPSVPFGFLLNLAVQANSATNVLSPQRADQAWTDAVRIATDLCALLGIEPAGEFWMMNATPRAMADLLRDIGIYDHLFGVRQWDLTTTPTLIQEFFRPGDAALESKHGWGVDDAVAFCRALTTLATSDPCRVTTAQIIQAGVRSEIVEKLLKAFAHDPGQVNQAYRSPLGAKCADLFLKPLIADDGDYLVSAASVAGPACYEAMAAALRTAAPSDQVNTWTGTGTERAVEALLRTHQLPITIVAAEHHVGHPTDAGECDLILEDDRNILLIECKAKPLTRATMEADPYAVLLDYSGAILAPQLQGMRHQRLLRQEGEIVFEDGAKLELLGRRITRLNVTLVDLGSLQDRLLLWQILEPWARSKVVVPAGHPQTKQLKDMNAQLDELRQEVAALPAQNITLRQWAMEGASLSYGQLSQVLSVATNLQKLIDALRHRATSGTLNPLIDLLTHDRLKKNV